MPNLLLACLMLFAGGAAAQAQSGKYKPQVIGDRADEAVQGGEAAGIGAPVQQDATPKPVGPQQPVLQPGQAGPQYPVNADNEEARKQMDFNRLNQLGEYFNGASGANGEYFGKGIMERCGEAPASAKQGFKDAMEFRQRCDLAKRGDNQMVAVNDFSTRPSVMYIFDQQGNCKGKTMVAFGNGAGGAQVACSDNGSHLTPPGAHLLAKRVGGGKFHSGNSMTMIGLQGQNSVGRGVLLHATGAPGTSSTWGCAGVGYDALGAVMKSLGEGAIMYNYFTSNQMANGCRSPAGRDKNAGCQMDSGSPGVPQNATGDGAPAVTWWMKLFNEAYAVAFPPRESIKKGTSISIYRYLPASGTYEITMTAEEAVGPNVAAPESLMKALGYKEPIKDFNKRMERNFSNGTVYTLKKDLPLLWAEEIFQLQLKRKRK